MFQTSPQMQLELPEQLSNPNCQRWHTVMQVLNCRWFQIIFFDKLQQYQKILFTGDMDVLEWMAKNNCIELLEVNLVSPSYLNGTAHWQLNRLVQVIARTVIDGSHEVLAGYEYLLADGQSFKDIPDAFENATDMNFKIEVINLV